MAKIDLMVKTNEEAMAAWDANQPVWTCSMGGLGPGYEQVIQLMTFEMLRSMLAYPVPPAIIIPEGHVMDDQEKADNRKAWRDYRDKIEKTPNVSKVMEDLGPTGAQFGAAFNLASVFIMNGYEKAVEMIPEGRQIMCSKKFPALSEGLKVG